MQVSKIVIINTLISIVLIVGFFVEGFPPMFRHANIFHLGVNIYCVYCVFHEWYLPWWLTYPIMLLIGWASLLGSGAIGFSTAIFAMVGLNYFIRLTWRNTLYLGGCILCSALLPNIAVIPHIVALCAGMMIGVFAETWLLFIRK